MANKVSDSVAVPGKQSRNERIEEFLREHYAFRYNTVKKPCGVPQQRRRVPPRDQIPAQLLPAGARPHHRHLHLGGEPAQHARKRLFRACESRASVFS